MSARPSPPAAAALLGPGGRLSPAWLGFLQRLCGLACAPAVGDFVVSAAAERGAGWLACDGRLVSRTDYAALFDVIGTTHGAGNGTDFALPTIEQTPWGGKTYIFAG